MTHRIVLVIVIAALLSLAQTSSADVIDDLRKEIEILKEKLSEMESLKVRVAELEKQLNENKCAILEQSGTVREVKESLINYRPGEGLEIRPCGLNIQAGATFVLQGTPDANGSGNRDKSRLDASWSADIFIEKKFDDWGLALIHLEPGQGHAVEDELSLYSNVNRDVNDTGSDIPLTELWYEHYLFNKQIAITLGKLDPANYIDQNEYAFDETTQFLGRIFRNNPAIEWPDDNTFGIRFIIAPEITPYLSFEATYFDADNDWESVFREPFISTQLNFKPSKIFNLDSEILDGNYRFYWWINARDHLKLVKEGELQADDAEKINTGFGLSCDQMLTDSLGIFGRLGWQRPQVAIVSANPNTAPVEMSWSSGVQLMGRHWYRSDDILGFGVGQAIPSAKYKYAGNGGAAEGHIELYYKCQISKNIAVTPDCQLIWNPRGISDKYPGDSDPIFVYGVRGQVDF